MKDIVIINASGFGREVSWMIKKAAGYGSGFKIKGFLDDRSEILKKYQHQHPILSSAEEYQPSANDVFVCAISDPKNKMKYASMIKEKGGTFINVINVSTLISENVTFGEGIIIANSCGISCDVHIGNFVTINAFSMIGHDAHIHDYVHINSFCSINGGVEIGESAVINAHAVILPSMKVGNSAVVGAGSVVLKDVPDNETVFGVPAIRVRT